MPSLLESVTDLLGHGDSFDKLATLVEAEVDQARVETGRAIPVILGGLADRVGDDDGPTLVNAILASEDGSALDDLERFLSRGDTTPGDAILDDVFGTESSDVVAALGLKSEMSGSAIAKLLAMLSPIVVGMVQRRRADDGLDRAELVAMLKVERSALEDDGLLESILEPTVTDRVPAAVGAVGGSDPRVVAMAAAGPGRSSADRGQNIVVDGTKASSAVDGERKTATNSAADGQKNGVGETPGSVASVASVGLQSGSEPGVSSAAKEVTSGVTVRESGLPREAEDGRSGGGLGWLWWAIGAVVLVLLLAWLLSTCNPQADQSDARSAVESAADGAAGQGSSADGDADAKLQSQVDTALADTGVTGTVAAGAVTLTGATDLQRAADDAEILVRGLDGVQVVINRIAVGQAQPAEPEAAMDETAEVEADETAEVEAEETGATDNAAETEGTAGQDSAGGPAPGTTINELLDLDPVTFDVSSAGITSEGQAVLDQAAAFLSENPDVSIEIAGHTDDDGAEDKNLLLSQARATAVQEYLQQAGIAEDRMRAQGYGESDPLVPNTSSAAKAENRRIEFIIL